MSVRFGSDLVANRSTNRSLRLRPAHIHCTIFKAGCKTQFAQLNSSDALFLETDAQFGVTRRVLIGRAKAPCRTASQGRRTKSLQ